MNGTAVFINRSDAGKQLAEMLYRYQSDPNSIVLALPRGGVPVAYEVAKILHLPLDIFVARKLGVPYQPELAMGAIASGGAIFFNADVIADQHISDNEVQRVIREEKAELERREIKYRQGGVFSGVTGKNIILVDDGIATGASVHSSVIALKKLKPKKMIIAIPVAPNYTLTQLLSLVDEVVCVHPVSVFYGVGAFYQDFTQTTDEEVIYYLNQLNLK